MASLQDYTEKQLFALEEKIRQVTLGADDETRRMMHNFQTYIDAERRRRMNTNTESTS